MAERVQNSSEFPNFDTYPAAPPSNESANLLEEHGVTDWPALDRRAAELGTAAGKLVVMARQARETLANLPHNAVFDPISNLAQTTRSGAENLRRLAARRAVQLTDAAREKALDLKHEAGAKAAVLGRKAKVKLERAQVRAAHVVREYPVHVAVAAGVAGFLRGVALRLRRANRAY